MLPTYPSIERYRVSDNADRIRKKTRIHAPLLGMISTHVQHEGRASTLSHEEGDVEDVEMEKVSAEIHFKPMKIAEASAQNLDAMLDDIALQMAKGMDAMMHRKINEVTTKTGNVVDGKGAGFSEDLFLEAMDKMDHSFDGNGVWDTPTIIVHPDVLAAVQARGLSAKGNRRLGEILERKLDDFRSREAARILVG